MGFRDKIAVVTGGANGIGKCIAQQFEKEGAQVCIVDLAENPCFVGDIADPEVLRRFADQTIGRHGHIDYLITNAKPLSLGVDRCDYEQFNYALRVGVSAPFLLTQLFLPYFRPGASIVNISSSRDRMSQPDRKSVV